MSFDVRSKMRNTAAELNNAMDGDSYGLSTVAAEVLERLVKGHPEMLQKLLTEIQTSAKATSTETQADDVPIAKLGKANRR